MSYSNGSCGVLPKYLFQDWNTHTPSCQNVGGNFLGTWEFPGLPESNDWSMPKYGGPCLKIEKLWRAIPTSKFLMGWPEAFVVTHHKQLAPTGPWEPIVKILRNFTSRLLNIAITKTYYINSELNKLYLKPR